MLLSQKLLRLVKKTHETYPNLFGLSPNTRKSEEFFAGIAEFIKDQILSILSFNEGSLPVSFLNVFSPKEFGSRLSIYVW